MSWTLRSSVTVTLATPNMSGDQLTQKGSRDFTLYKGLDKNAVLARKYKKTVLRQFLVVLRVLHFPGTDRWELPSDARWTKLLEDLHCNKLLWNIPWLLTLTWQNFEDFPWKPIFEWSSEQSMRLLKAEVTNYAKDLECCRKEWVLHFL